MDDRSRCPAYEAFAKAWKRLPGHCPHCGCWLTADDHTRRYCVEASHWIAEAELAEVTLDWIVNPAPPGQTT
jgi:hypothetical protein